MDKNGLKFLVFLLLFINVCLCGYIVYDKGFSNNDIGVKKDKVKSEIEILEVNDPLVSNLLKKIDGRMDCSDDNIYLRDEKFTASNFSNEDMYQLLLNNIYSKISDITVIPYVYKDFTTQELNDELENVVGKDYKFSHKTYNSCPEWKYDDIEKVYKAPIESTCGCTMGPYHNIKKIVKVTKENNIVNIYFRVIFVDKQTGKGYKDYAMSEEIPDLIRLSDTLAIDENSVNNINKGTLYKVVFEDENNNYIFKSAEPVE